jgi:exopolyphosphatase/guanosine-5'-triphosphate,3'-diphosphate pyrophosphatase
VDIGCVRLTERCLPGDPPTAQEIAAAVEVAMDTLAVAFDAVDVREARTFIGVAGTVTTLSAVNQGLAEYDPERTHLSTMSLSEIRRTTAGLLELTREQRAEIQAIHPGRVDVIGGGALIVRTVAEQLAVRAGLTEMVVSEHDILDGIALSLA